MHIQLAASKCQVERAINGSEHPLPPSLARIHSLELRAASYSTRVERRPPPPDVSIETWLYLRVVNKASLYSCGYIDRAGSACSYIASGINEEYGRRRTNAPRPFRSFDPLTSGQNCVKELGLTWDFRLWVCGEEVFFYFVELVVSQN